MRERPPQIVGAEDSRSEEEETMQIQVTVSKEGIVTGNGGQTAGKVDGFTFDLMMQVGIVCVAACGMRMRVCMQLSMCMCTSR